jgi:hypothetical protein
MDDATEFECRPGDVSLVPSGHDAWVIGDEATVVADFQGMIDYAAGLSTPPEASSPRSASNALADPRRDAPGEIWYAFRVDRASVLRLDRLMGASLARLPERD